MLRLRAAVVRVSVADADLAGVVARAARRVSCRLHIQLCEANGPTLAASEMLQRVVRAYAAAEAVVVDTGCDVTVTLESTGNSSSNTSFVAGHHLVPLGADGAELAAGAVALAADEHDAAAVAAAVAACRAPSALEFPDGWAGMMRGSMAQAVIGGTFDRLHTAHKVLLTAGLLVSRDGMTVGVTSDAMVANKTLGDLIAPGAVRRAAVADFCRRVRPSLPVTVEEITDPVGPAGTVAALDALVFSPDVLSGLPSVRQARAANGLAPLLELCIPLLPSALTHTEKMSSTELRHAALAAFVPRPLSPRKARVARPYTVGLTGTIASGKSSAAKFLASEHNAVVIDCDVLGHEAYRPGEQAYEPLIARFGRGILADDGTVNRRALGPLVFGNPEALRDLNAIVWPVIRSLALRAMAAADPNRICVIDAAVLLVAGWHDIVDEVWTVFVPRKEAIKRLMERNKLSEEDATTRVQAQPPTREYLEQSNVAICSLWEYEKTRAQLAQAWRGAEERAARASRAADALDQPHADRWHAVFSGRVPKTSGLPSTRDRDLLADLLTVNAADFDDAVRAQQAAWWWAAGGDPDDEHVRALVAAARGPLWPERPWSKDQVLLHTLVRQVAGRAAVSLAPQHLTVCTASIDTPPSSSL